MLIQLSEILSVLCLHGITKHSFNAPLQQMRIQALLTVLSRKHTRGTSSIKETLLMLDFQNKQGQWNKIEQHLLVKNDEKGL